MIQQMLIRWLIANWLKVLIGVALVGGVGAIYQTGYNAAAQTREVEVAGMKRDLDAARVQRADAEAAAKELAQQDVDNEQQLQKLRDQLAARDPAAPRGLTQSELDILLGRSKAGKR